MSTPAFNSPGLLPACRELLASHPESVLIREQVEALEAAIPDNPGIAVSFCRTIIETTCKTILKDRGQTVQSSWEAPKLISEALKYVDLGRAGDAATDATVRSGTEHLVRGLGQIVQGVIEIRNEHGSAAHGADAYAPGLDPGYAEILARATDAVVGLLFRTHIRSLRPDTLVRFRYRDHAEFDEFIDNDYGPFPVLDVMILASEALFRTDFEAYRTALVDFLSAQETNDSDEGVEELEAQPVSEELQPEPTGHDSATGQETE